MFSVLSANVSELDSSEGFSIEGRIIGVLQDKRQGYIPPVFGLGIYSSTKGVNNVSYTDILPNTGYYIFIPSCGHPDIVSLILIFL